MTFERHISLVITNGVAKQNDMLSQLIQLHISPVHALNAGKFIRSGGGGWAGISQK